MSEKYLFKVAYVLTSNGADIYADMALVSMLSVRISNPGLQIIIVCDEKSATSIKATKHRLLDVCDELISVKTPDGESTFRNRWIKTQLCKFVPGPCLYLDVDTLVRGTLDELPSIVTDFGAVANHNGLTHQEQLWDEDAAEMSKMNWLPELAFFPNGGVFFYHSTEATSRFFRLWHELWQKSFEKLGRARDQPACYAALSECEHYFIELPAEYNWQVMFKPQNWEQARILHFYNNPVSMETIFGKLLDTAPHVAISNLKSLVRKSIVNLRGWPNDDSIAKFILKFTDNYSVSARLWLLGRRWSAFRVQMGVFRKQPFFNSVFK